MTWSDRERGLLAVTLRLRQERGYEGLTLDEVAAASRASKATMYRRWPTKAELVLAAVLEGMSQETVAPETGTLRTDLLAIGETISKQARSHATTMRAVLVEASLTSGTLTALREAVRLGRPAMVMPGPVTSAQSAGCHDALRRYPDVRLVTDAADVLAELDTPASASPSA